MANKVEIKCDNCSAVLNSSEAFKHKQTCIKYKVKESEAIALCSGCTRTRDAVQQRALEADEGQPYVEW